MRVTVRGIGETGVIMVAGDEVVHSIRARAFLAAALICVAGTAVRAETPASPACIDLPASAADAALCSLRAAAEAGWLQPGRMDGEGLALSLDPLGMPGTVSPFLPALFVGLPGGAQMPAAEETATAVPPPPGVWLGLSALMALFGWRRLSA